MMIDHNAMQIAASELGFSVSKRKNAWFLTKDHKRHWLPLPSEEAAWEFAFSWMSHNLEIFYDPSADQLLMLCPSTKASPGMIFCADLSGNREVWHLPETDFIDGGRFLKVVTQQKDEGPWSSKT